MLLNCFLSFGAIKTYETLKSMSHRIVVQAFKLISNEVDVALEKTYMIVIRVVDFRNNPLKDVNVKVFMLEKKPITIEQWGENLKNGSPFKRLILSMNSDATGSVTSKLAICLLYTSPSPRD